MTAFAGAAVPIPNEKWWQRYRSEYWVEMEIYTEADKEWWVRLVPLRCIRGRFWRSEALRFSPESVERAIPLRRKE